MLVVLKLREQCIVIIREKEGEGGKYRRRGGDLLVHGDVEHLLISYVKPWQSRPPCCGGIHALDLTLEPLPQVTLHGVQLPHTDNMPSTVNKSRSITSNTIIYNKKSMHLKILYLVNVLDKVVIALLILLCLHSARNISSLTVISCRIERY